LPLLRQVRLADLRALLRVLAGWPQASPYGMVPRGVALGAVAYLVKPVSRDEVLAALASCGIVPPARAGARPRRSEHW